MGKLMVSFHFLFKLDDKTLAINTYTTFLLGALVFSQLSLYANFNALNIHLALLPALLFSVIQFANTKINKQNKRFVIVLFLSVFVVDLAALIPVIIRLKFK